MNNLSEKAVSIIQTFQLEKHIEGGWFKRTFQSDEINTATKLANNSIAQRFITTSIVYLLCAGEFSAFHKLQQYETWHFYSGDPLCIYWFDEIGQLHSQTLGSNYEKGELSQITMKPNTYFAAELQNNADYAFVGCSVTPGFDYEDFSIATQSQLLELYPEHVTIITRLTRS